MRADFYILSTNTRQKRIDMICKISEKAYLQQKSTLIYVADVGLANEIDERLWTFKDDSFIPHTLHADPRIPICIGEYSLKKDILINVADHIPPHPQQFSHIIEVAHEDNTLKQKLREHYTYYKKKGFDLHTHHRTG